MVERDRSTTEELVKMARNLERLMVRRRKALQKVNELDQDIRATRSLIRQLSLPFTVEAGELPDDGHAAERIGAGS